MISIKYHHQRSEYGVGDEPEFSSWSKCKAMKPYHCHECLLPIGKGELYEVLSGRWAGRFERYRYCSSCKAWADAALWTLKLDAYPLGSLDEAIASLAKQPDGSYSVVQKVRL